MIAMFGWPEKVPRKLYCDQNFRSLSFLQLAGYNIEYSRTSEGFLLKLLLQMPRFISSIRAEHRWLNRTIKISWI